MTCKLRSVEHDKKIYGDNVRHKREQLVASRALKGRTFDGDCYAPSLTSINCEIVCGSRLLPSNHSLKVDALQEEPIMTRDRMRQTVFEYIEVDYNRTRRHSARSYLVPENFELKNSA